MVSVNDGYVAVGYSDSSDGDLAGINKGQTDAIIVKYDLNGNVIWKKTFGGNGNESYEKIIAIPNGYIVVGESDSINGNLISLNHGEGDAIIVKYDLNGNVVWNKNFGGSSTEEFRSVIQIPGGYVAAGISYSTDKSLAGLNKGYADAILVKFDLDGNMIWNKNYGGTNYDVFNGLSEVDNGFIAAGESYSKDKDLLKITKGEKDAILVKYDFNGNILWKKNHGGIWYETFNAVISDGTEIIGVGTRTSTDCYFSSLPKTYGGGMLIKMDNKGNVHLPCVLVPDSDFIYGNSPK